MKGLVKKIIERVLEEGIVKLTFRPIRYEAKEDVFIFYISNKSLSIELPKSYELDDIIISIIDALKNNLRTLEFEEYLSEPVGQKLIELIKENKNLKTLILKRQEFESRELFENIINALKMNNSIKELDFSYSNIDYMDACKIARLITINQSIKSLNLCKTNRHNFGSSQKKIFDAISENNSINELSFNSTPIYEALIFAKHVQNIKSLDFGNCQMGDRGAYFLKDSMFKHNLPNLEELDLSGNRLSDLGAGFISQGLEFVQKLKQLSLERNFITGNGLVGLLKSVVKNLPKMEKLFICGYYGTNDGMMNISQYFKVAKDILELSKNVVAKKDELTQEDNLTPICYLGPIKEVGKEALKIEIDKSIGKTLKEFYIQRLSLSALDKLVQPIIHDYGITINKLELYADLYY